MKDLTDAFNAVADKTTKQDQENINAAVLEVKDIFKIASIPQEWRKIDNAHYRLDVAPNIWLEVQIWGGRRGGYSLCRMSTIKRFLKKKTKFEDKRYISDVEDFVEVAKEFNNKER